MDLLGVDRGGNVVVVELKRIARRGSALEYATCAVRLDVDEMEDILSEYRPDEPSGLADLHQFTAGRRGTE